MRLLEKPLGTNKKNLILNILFNMAILLFVFGIVAVQYGMDLTLLESKLLNFMFMIPVSLAVYRFGIEYGIAISLAAIICHFVFPLNEWSSSYRLPALMILASQLLMFAIWSLLVIKVKKKFAALDAEIQKKDGLIKKADDKSNSDILEVLVKVIDAKDAYTYQHSKRVAYYAKSLAISSGLSEEAADRIYIAGMLHDIGKIGLNENILNKSTLLTENEKLEAARHPMIGARIAENLNCFKDVIPGIYYHHEVYNGSGHPEGLRGDAIPLAARIISIADAFDAMTSDRSYRVGMPVEDAVKRLIENIGNQFDPHLIVTFIDLLKNKAIFIEAKKA